MTVHSFRSDSHLKAVSKDTPTFPQISVQVDNAEIEPAKLFRKFSFNDKDLENGSKLKEKLIIQKQAKSAKLRRKPRNYKYRQPKQVNNGGVSNRNLGAGQWNGSTTINEVDICKCSAMFRLAS